jgi:hypothetical protein
MEKGFKIERQNNLPSESDISQSEDQVPLQDVHYLQWFPLN